jgi:hypothetical protein
MSPVTVNLENAAEHAVIVGQQGLDGLFMEATMKKKKQKKNRSKLSFCPHLLLG